MHTPERQDERSDTPRFIEELEAAIPQMRAFARSLCRNADLADDIVQDTCMKAWAARDRFTPGAPMKPWLFRILRNVHAQIGRRAWRSVAIDPTDAENALIAPDALQWTADVRALQAALNRLPLKQREAITIVLVAGFSYEEAGLILSCSEGTVKSRVSRGREALLHLMGESEIRPATQAASDALGPDGLTLLTDLLDGSAPKAA